ncbi:MAG: sugar ABC transporter ATP-binding protein [Spirochaetales bacterium]|nr:sugar ABC transporter ATP-binding protein [Spirochaetales bacterium]
MSDLFLSMHGVSKRYTGVQALDRVDLEIARGEIHCLVGENGSGKSTLIKIISGVEQPDPGARIEIDGQVHSHYHSIDSIRRGIEVIYQDLSLFPNTTVAENIALAQTIASDSHLISWREVRRIARAAMDRVGVRIPLDELVHDLSVADQQLVAICRALTSDVRLLILDEPTTALTRREVDGLFKVIRDLQSKGIATLFISHKLDEVLQIAERVTILRDGRKVGTYPSGELNGDKLTLLMTGKQVEFCLYEYSPGGQPPLLEVRNLAKEGNFRDISFALYPGEILGITGLLGSGRTELAQALFGMNPPESGEVLVEGRPVRLRSVRQAIELGVGYVPENRLVQGLVMEQSVARNIVVTIVEKLRGMVGLIDERRRQTAIERWIRELSIRVPSPESPVQTLSGGNQQRVVLAKWMATDPKILILDGPTVGIDVAAKSSMHDILRGLAEQGMGVIVISDEVSEVYHNCNRVLIMHKGRILAEYRCQDSTEEEIQSRINAAG